MCVNKSAICYTRIFHSWHASADRASAYQSCSSRSCVFCARARLWPCAWTTLCPSSLAAAAPCHAASITKTYFSTHIYIGRQLYNTDLELSRDPCTPWLEPGHIRTLILAVTYIDLELSRDPYRPWIFVLQSRASWTAVQYSLSSSALQSHILSLWNSDVTNHCILTSRVATTAMTHNPSRGRMKRKDLCTLTPVFSRAPLSLCCGCLWLPSPVPSVTQSHTASPAHAQKPYVNINSCESDWQCRLVMIELQWY